MDIQTLIQLFVVHGEQDTFMSNYRDRIMFIFGPFYCQTSITRKIKLRFGPTYGDRIKDLLQGDRKSSHYGAVVVIFLFRKHIWI